MSTSGINNIVSSGHGWGWTICAAMTEQTNSQQPQTPLANLVLMSVQPKIVVQVEHHHDSGWMCGWYPSLDQRFFLTTDHVVVNVLRTDIKIGSGIGNIPDCGVFSIFSLGQTTDG
jgi:hypothetical protein